MAERRLALLTDHIEVLRAAFRETHRRHPFTIDAIVVLPDHLHTVWTLSEDDADFAMRWQLIKSAFSRGLARNERVRDWAPSSFHRHVKLGNDPVDWAGDQSDDGRDYGELG